MTTNPFELLQEAIERMEARFIDRLDQISFSVAPSAIGPEEQLSPDQLSVRLKLKKSTVLRYARNNTIPSYKSGNRYTFRLSEVTAALSSTAKIPKKKGMKI